MDQVLLLNATYQPICSVTMKRAIVLVLQGKAEVVSSYEGREMRSENLSIPAPSVIRLLKFVAIPRFRKAYLTRRAILQRDGNECCYCGGKANTMDHIVPRSKGGKHSWDNVVACCFPCNQRKDDKSLEEIGWAMRYKPSRPEGPKRFLLIVGRVDPSWEEWIAMAPMG